MYEGAALSFGLIRACRGGLVLYCSVLSHAGGENDGSSAIFERSLLADSGQNELDNNLQTTFSNKFFVSENHHIYILITSKLVSKGLNETW